MCRKHDTRNQRPDELRGVRPGCDQPSTPVSRPMPSCSSGCRAIEGLQYARMRIEIVRGTMLPRALEKQRQFSRAEQCSLEARTTSEGAHRFFQALCEMDMLCTVSRQSSRCFFECCTTTFCSTMRSRTASAHCQHRDAKTEQYTMRWPLTRPSPFRGSSAILCFAF
jgi:hypothetical protein